MSLETRAHLSESAARIDEALKANMQRTGFESQIVHLDRHRAAPLRRPHRITGKQFGRKVLLTASANRKEDSREASPA